MVRLVAAVLAGLSALLVTAAPTHAQDATGASDAGEVLYNRDCAWCHGPDGQGSPYGVTLVDAGAASAHYYLSTGRMPIDDPDERVRRGEPAYSEGAIDALVAYVASLGDGPAIPDLRPAAADLALGGRLYRLHCAQCHGTAGVGVALAFDVVAPSVLPATSTHVAEALAIGPGAMPVFTGAVLTEDEAAAVVRYVEELQDPVDRGGLPFARSGRLDELVVAWSVGVGALVLGARWIARAR